MLSISLILIFCGVEIVYGKALLQIDNLSYSINGNITSEVLSKIKSLNRWGRKMNFKLDPSSLVVKPKKPLSENERRSQVIQRFTKMKEKLKTSRSVQQEDIELLMKVKKNVPGYLLKLEKYDLEYHPTHIFYDTDGRNDPDVVETKITKLYFYVPSESLFVSTSHRVIINQVKALFKILNGRELEIISSEMEPPEARNDQYWTFNWTESDYSRALYQDYIHPPVAQAVVAAIGKLRNFGSIFILDIFGGDGSLLKLFRKYIPGFYPDLEIRYGLMDRNESLIAKARKELDNVKIYDSVDIPEQKSLSKMLDKKPKIITATGGFIFKGIERKDARHVAEMVFHALDDGGYFIASGIPLSHLSSYDFEAIGYEVINASIPQNVFTDRSPGQLYILKKPDKESQTKLDNKSLFKSA